MNLTLEGKELARKLETLVGKSESNNLEEICSLICGYSKTHHWLQEQRCNNPKWNGYMESHEIEVEDLIFNLVNQLPEAPGIKLVPVFGGDPRGGTVKLVISGFVRHPSYDGWCGEAIIVPGSTGE